MNMAMGFEWNVGKDNEIYFQFIVHQKESE
jgi:hypothetical protein